MHSFHLTLHLGMELLGHGLASVNTSKQLSQAVILACCSLGIFHKDWIYQGEEISRLRGEPLGNFLIQERGWCRREAHRRGRGQYVHSFWQVLLANLLSQFFLFYQHFSPPSICTLYCFPICFLSFPQHLSQNLAMSLCRWAVEGMGRPGGVMSLHRSF